MMTTMTTTMVMARGATEYGADGNDDGDDDGGGRRQQRGQAETMSVIK
jgi:hypothetical protein